ncbi:MAG: hypothetical protein QNJ47_17385 [Nostocaceae cyanobacterium]|nr:hypothetical protein [Nostocaceae cyanobacterium]
MSTPINDNFADSLELIGSSITTTGSNINATGEVGEPIHEIGAPDVFGQLASVWWSWTAPDDGIIAADTLGSNFDTILAAYTGEAVDNLSLIRSNDLAIQQGNIPLAAITFTVEEGQTYHFAVDGFDDAEGLINLNLNLFDIDLNNDDFANSVDLIGTSINTIGTNVDFTGEAGEPNHANSNLIVDNDVNSAWWSWTPIADGEVTINTLGSNYDTTLSIYTGLAVDSLTEVASNDDTIGSFQSQVTFTAIAGQTYHIAVDGFADSVGVINLNIDQQLDFTQVGTSGNDNLFGTSAIDVIDGGAGNDNIYGNGGEDILLGGDGNDAIFGSSSSDYIEAGSGNDIVYGNGGKDTLLGGDGNDLIFGGSQTDIIKGGAGDDIIYGNGGNDLIDSGSGYDIVWLGSGEAIVALKTGAGYDTINNFQLGSTKFQVSSVENLSFADSVKGVQIFQEDDLLAVVSSQSADTFSNNVDQIFMA